MSRQTKQDDPVEAPEPQTAHMGIHGPFTIRFLYRVSLYCEESGSIQRISFMIYKFDNYPDLPKFFYSTADGQDMQNGQTFCGPFVSEKMAAAAVAEEWLTNQLNLRYQTFLQEEKRREGE